MQVAIQLIVYTTSKSFLWVLLLPHIPSIIAIFTFFATNSGKIAANIAQLCLSFTLLTDSMLLLVLAYAMIECTANGKSVYNLSILFGSNICQGSSYDGGLTEALSIVFTLGSITLQGSQLISIENYIKVKFSGLGGLAGLVITFALYMYTTSFLLHNQKYLIFAADVISGLCALIAFGLQHKDLMMAETTKKIRTTLTIIEYFFYVGGFVLSLGIAAFVIADTVALCNKKETSNAMLNQALFCTFTSTLSASFFGVIILVRMLIQFIIRFSTSQVANDELLKVSKRR
jgi:hypothetical protein